MATNPPVDRYLRNAAIDHIDHALGRPIYPLRESSRNYFATDAGGELASAFEASDHWGLTGVSGDMAYYHVTDAGRRALAEHLAGLDAPWAAFAVTFEGHETVVPAKSSGAARYRHYLRISDAWADLTFADFCRGSTVRRVAA